MANRQSIQHFAGTLCSLQAGTHGRRLVGRLKMFWRSMEKAQPPTRASLKLPSHRNCSHVTALLNLCLAVCVEEIREASTRTRKFRPLYGKKQSISIFSGKRRKTNSADHVGGLVTLPG